MRTKVSPHQRMMRGTAYYTRSAMEKGILEERWIKEAESIKPKTKPIYQGRHENFHWVGFGSGSGTNLRECARIIKPSLIVCDRPNAVLLGREELADVPKIIIDGYKMCGSWRKGVGNSRMEKEYLRKSTEYNHILNEKIIGFERKNSISIDLIVLGGYMRLVKDPLLSRFKDKIINVHPADLTIMDEYMTNNRRYTGNNAVLEAIMACEESTKSSVILVDEQTDHGEILVQGPRLNIREDICNMIKFGNTRIVREYAKSHQDAQKIVSDWPAITMTLELISKGEIALSEKKVFHNEWRKVYISGKPYGSGGLQM